VNIFNPIQSSQIRLIDKIYLILSSQAYELAVYPSVRTSTHMAYVWRLD
jgi:hypothetical protein